MSPKVAAIVIASSGLALAVFCGSTLSDEVRMWVIGAIAGGFGFASVRKWYDGHPLGLGAGLPAIAVYGAFVGIAAAIGEGF